MRPHTLAYTPRVAPSCALRNWSTPSESACAWILTLVTRGFGQGFVTGSLIADTRAEAALPVQSLSPLYGMACVIWWHIRSRQTKLIGHITECSYFARSAFCFLAKLNVKKTGLVSRVICTYLLWTLRHWSGRRSSASFRIPQTFWLRLEHKGNNWVNTHKIDFIVNKKTGSTFTINLSHIARIPLFCLQCVNFKLYAQVNLFNFSFNETGNTF